MDRRTEMKIKLLVLVIVVFSLIIVSRSFAQNFPTYHQLGPAKATLWRPTSGTPQHRYRYHASHKQFSELGSLQGNEQPGFCGPLHQYPIRQQRIASHLRTNCAGREGRSELFLRQNQSGLTPGITKSRALGLQRRRASHELLSGGR